MYADWHKPQYHSYYWSSVTCGYCNSKTNIIAYPVFGQGQDRVCIQERCSLEEAFKWFGELRSDSHDNWCQVYSIKMRLLETSGYGIPSYYTVANGDKNYKRMY